MIRSRAIRIFAGLTLAAGAFPAIALKPKASAAPLPPYAGAYQPQTVDERGQWMEADEAERKLRDSEFVIRDPALNDYVRQVLCRTVGTDRCSSVRLYILRVPAFNAYMTANGALVVWSGLLLRMRSEAELAAVLGHEFAHFEERHLLAEFRQRRSATDVMAWAALFGVAGQLVQLGAAGSVFSFSRDEERAADVKSFSYLAASEYRPGAFGDIWGRMMDEADATAAGRRQHSKRYAQVAFFADHPTDLERATYLRAMAAKQGDDGEDDGDRYRAAMAKWTPEFLTDQIKLNDFGGTEYLLNQLAGDNWTGDLLFARGELYRLRGNPRDLVAAAQFYRDAIAKGLAEPACHRSLGMVLLRSNAPVEARQALEDYLKMQPDASDKGVIAMLIEQAGAN